MTNLRFKWPNIEKKTTRNQTFVQKTLKSDANLSPMPKHGHRATSKLPTLRKEPWLPDPAKMVRYNATLDRRGA